ncbi:P-type conjugative transfer protein VirB9 [Vibrio alginolyticus]|uniref:P-type conjugative transfer protein VirB9 n=1 Tax=Vibrio alginolyticus TaxID=663 RepID=UPI002119E19E|nr:P-type conjugative transfer protein VirB9 [Vibrio alginolyticus]MCQ9091009.1 P-type conjugative transfer protein VirB9 [Vibrio alginolyticus]
MKTLLLTTCLLGLSSGALALDVPDQSPRDSNIQTTDYRDNDVVTVTAYVGMSTHIVFSPDETIKHEFTGFADGWEITPKENHLFIKAISTKGTESYVDEEGKEVKEDILITPTPRDWKTNLNVVTNKHNYSFALNLGYGEAGRRQNTYRLTFSYPEDEAKRKALELEKQELRKQLTPEVNAKNWDYVMQVGNKSRGIAPIKAFDDGRFTYLTFAQNSEIPAIFIISETGQETLINSHIAAHDPDTIVVQRLSKQLVLRLDDAVVGITNQAFDTISVDTHTGSTVKGVKRTIKE